ncbi:type IV pilus biogenesis protein PilP [Salmonella enterica]|nr:type IV pilus biogenesis protein PilP [Salmonella enterica]EIG1170449.1 type IV pilus biogenesis protein PilP [Salmonella enterica subsp. diarizonae serovar 48:k:z53]HAU3151316.1 type IV pilus biogenesis protein PilP [Salmonella enterica subsp. diarizonae]EDT1279386.1 type IV pilus biogenesis protein PilP [Salmonella enterica]EDY3377860.1 type IV pilus biogenesis protein PilP [Salmonella enterica]
MRINNGLLVAITLQFISASVIASQSKSVSLPPTQNEGILITSESSGGDELIAQKLTKLKSEVLILNAEAKKAEAQKHLNEVTGGKKHSVGEGEIVLPRVKTIFGRGENLHAELELDDGNIVEVSPGDKSIFGIEITAITKSSVVVRMGDTSVSIPLLHLSHKSARNKDNYIPQPIFQ